MNDLRYATRQLARAPLFTVAASLSIAVGVIVAVAAFTLLDVVLLKPLQIPNADGLHHVYTSDGDGRSEAFGSSSYADYNDFARSGAFTSLAAATWDQVPVSVGSAAPAIDYVGFISPNYFSTLQMNLLRGRAPAEEGSPEIVITHAYWQRMFGGEAGALGRTVKLNGVTMTVVGVAPESFHGVGMGPPLIGWASAAMLPQISRNANVLRHRGARSFALFGRLADGVSTASANARLNAVAATLAEQAHDSWTDRNNETRLVTVLTNKESLAPGKATELMLAILGVGMLVLFVLLLACTNVAALLLGRAVGRHHEIAVRMSLGASRRRLMQQLLTESVLLAVIGGTLSLLGLTWAMRVVRTLPIIGMFDFVIDMRVLTVALLTSLLCALLFGLAPALQSVRVDLRAGLAGTASSRERNRFRGALIAAQVAASCVLILVAFTAVRGVRTYLETSPGVDTVGLLTIGIDNNPFGNDTAAISYYALRTREIVETTPGVRSASSTVLIPLGNSNTGASLDLGDGEERSVEVNTVGRTFFETVGLSAIRGRTFDDRDSRTSAPVAVVNHAFLEQFGNEVTDRAMTVSDREGVRVVGVVPEIAYHDPKRPQQPLMYLLDEQIPWESSRKAYLLRVAPGAERAMAATLRAEFRRAFPDAVIPTVEPLRDFNARQTMPQRIAGSVALGVGGIELALASVGLYGLLMFALLARRREIGVRLALGATSKQASWAVMQDGMRYAGYGIAAGLLLAVPAVVVLRQALPGATSIDPMPFLFAIATVSCAALLSAWYPARRAAQVQPAQALRQD